MTTPGGGVRSRVALLLLLIANPIPVGGLLCFSCYGKCHLESPCNCQTGACVGDYCFEERWNKGNSVIIYKGCAKGQSRLGSMNSCSYQRVKGNSYCMCNKKSFCNNWDDVSGNVYDNVTCMNCGGGGSKSGCSRKCSYGDYCWADVVHNSYTCAFGPPVLPFHYQDRRLQQTHAKPYPACSSFKAGQHTQSVECVCTQPLCNEPLTLQEQMYFDYDQLLQCHSCEESVISESPLPSCRRQTCAGQFCVIKTELISDTGNGGGGGGLGSSVGHSGGGGGGGVGVGVGGGGAKLAWTGSKTLHYRHWAGCVNSTRPSSVLRGSVQRWTDDYRHVIECACRRDFCNLNVHTCMKISAGRRRTFGSAWLLTIPCLVCVFWTVGR